MPIFGGVKSWPMRRLVELTAFDLHLVERLSETAYHAEELVGTHTLLQVRKSIERLRVRALIKQLPQGKWIAQKGKTHGEFDDVATSQPARRRRAA